ncbi:MAG: ATP-binding cassette domain-containing protein [Deltaproteobacteria bacterium]|nr:ATP-binding cassette domain-containing protein [Deltaproteobacteria bacterium]
MNTAMFRLESVSLAFRPGRFLFRNVTLEVACGDVALLQGPSGCGKSSFLKLLNRIQEPSEGKIFFEGRSVDHFPVTELRRRVSYLHQSPVLLKGSVGENLRLPFSLRASGRKNAPGEAELRQWLERYLLSEVSLEDAAENCSVGQKQRLCLIRALLLNPEVLLLDEPTSALDEESASIVEREIVRANRETGVSVFWVTHHPVNLPTAVPVRRFKITSQTVSEG